MHPYKIIFLLSFSMMTSFANSQEIPPPPPPTDSAGAGGRIFEKVDKEASYEGGDAAWRKFLEKNLNPNVPVDNGAPAGLYTVYVQFIVDRDGSIYDIKPLTEQGYGMEQEVVRILKKAGRWIPAMQNDRQVKAYRKQPVTFQVTDEQFEIVTKVPYVLYTGTDNAMTVDVYKVKDENLQLTISQGTITSAGNGRYIVRVNKTGRIIISIYNTKKKKEVGKASFEVKNAIDK